jgi:hypothetical protein
MTIPIGSTGSLTSVSIINCPSISDKGIISALAKCTQLRHLTLEGLDLITDDGLCEAISALLQLQSVRINKCEKLTDNSISFIMSNCGPNIVNLGIQSVSIDICISQL